MFEELAYQPRIVSFQFIVLKFKVGYQMHQIQLHIKTPHTRQTPNISNGGFIEIYRMAWKEIT
jgi:hypothetical protein